MHYTKFWIPIWLVYFRGAHNAFVFMFDPKLVHTFFNFRFHRDEIALTELIYQPSHFKCPTMGWVIPRNDIFIVWKVEIAQNFIESLSCHRIRNEIHIKRWISCFYVFQIPILGDAESRPDLSTSQRILRGLSKGSNSTSPLNLVHSFWAFRYLADLVQ